VSPPRPAGGGDAGLLGTKVDADSSASTGRCPACHAPCSAEDKFCEVCGRDLLQAPSSSGSRREQPDDSGAGHGATTAWKAIVEANRAFYVFNHAFYEFADHEHQFPGEYPARVIALSKPTIEIGRSSKQRQIQPDIDLREPPPEDQLVSHRHAILELQSDGSYTLTDNRSANGTFLNAETKPIPPGVPVRIKDGDRIYVGAWTRIRFRAG
jgi:hypothetical protein